MKILVANLGSTSFKYRLFDMADESQLARGGIERIGADESHSYVEIGEHRDQRSARVPDHAEAVRICLAGLSDPENGCLSDTSEVAAIGLKTVHGGRISGVQRVTDQVLEAMEEMNRVAPAHNPPYIAAMRQLGRQLPQIPLVAAFETAFHDTIPDRHRYYAAPFEWAEKHYVRRWGFHGASHSYIAGRLSEILGRDDPRIISCHLGGSSSLCAIRNGQSTAASMGMSPQSGLPQNNRAGDFDPFALPHIIQQTGKTLEEVLDQLASDSGLLGLSGISGDLRDLERVAAEGNARARLALDVYVAGVRHYLGGMLVELGGTEAIVFTGGIGENSLPIRSAVCDSLEELGIVLDTTANETAAGEAKINDTKSRVEIWVVPTNEEIVVARQVNQLLQG